MHAKDGVDFMTIHCGINKATAKKFRADKRLMNIVSRGGSIIYAWMEMTGNENPFFEYYDRVLEICREYDVTMSLGDACRPGCIMDASDISQIEELVTLGELTRRAWEKDVQVMVEGPGHMPLNQIKANMEIQQTICKGAPFYVLGPLVTDIAPRSQHMRLILQRAYRVQWTGIIRWTRQERFLTGKQCLTLRLTLRRQELTELHLSLRRKIHVLCVVISVQ